MLVQLLEPWQLLSIGQWTLLLVKSILSSLLPLQVIPLPSLQASASWPCYSLSSCCQRPKTDPWKALFTILKSIKPRPTMISIHPLLSMTNLFLQHNQAFNSIDSLSSISCYPIQLYNKSFLFDMNTAPLFTTWESITLNITLYKNAYIPWEIFRCWWLESIPQQKVYIKLHFTTTLSSQLSPFLHNNVVYSSESSQQYQRTSVSQLSSRAFSWRSSYYHWFRVSIHYFLHVSWLTTSC